MYGFGLKIVNFPFRIVHKCTINDNYMMYGSRDMKCDRQNFCHFGTFFALLPPLTTQKIKILKKWRKHMEISSFYTSVPKIMIIYCSLDMASNRFNYFSFWAIFYPFTSLTAQKIKILKKWKKHLEISSFYTSVPKIMIICYTVPEIWWVTDVIIFHFGPFFALLPKKSKLKKNEKKAWRYHHFTQVYQKSWPYAILFLRYGVWQM